MRSVNKEFEGKDEFIEALDRQSFWIFFLGIYKDGQIIDGKTTKWYFMYTFFFLVCCLIIEK